MSNKLKIPCKNKTSNENLDYFSQNILLLANILEKYFNQNIAYHFQIQTCEGFEYAINDNFVATNSLSYEFKKIYESEDNSIVMRFLCNTEKKLFTKNKDDFCEKLTEPDSSPLFFVTPYENSKEEEYSYILSANFEVKLIITKNDFSLNINNYKEESHFIKKIFHEISALFLKKEFHEQNNFNPKSNECIIENNLILKSSLLKTNNPSQEKIKHNASLLNNDIKEIIDKAKNYMNKGDCYLANLTSTIALNEKKNFITFNQFIKTWIKLKSRYGIFYKNNLFGIACFSPERFIYSNNKKITTEPIKGTLKSLFSSPTIEDAKKIWSDEKEMYEHTLVVDLMRNDLNNICQPGSVQVYRPFFARKSGNLIQMQSSVLGVLKENKTLGSCLQSMLPAGSITGTPKKKVCEIISRLEKKTRGYYTGVCGILEMNGDFDSTILIRSVYMGARGIYCGVGAGITTLSNTENEYEEFLIKLNSFLTVLESQA